MVQLEQSLEHNRKAIRKKGNGPEKVCVPLIIFERPQQKRNEKGGQEQAVTLAFDRWFNQQTEWRHASYNQHPAIQVSKVVNGVDGICENLNAGGGCGDTALAAEVLAPL